MSAILVTREQAIAHLRIPAPVPDTEADRDLTEKLDNAEAVVLAKINASLYWREITPTWDAMTAPRPVQQAILLELGDLWVERGDGTLTEDRPRDAVHGLLIPIAALLSHYLDPVI